jgi:ABC-type glycerol-3-phosphate transport system permease component
MMVSGEGRIRQALRVWLPVGFFLVLALFPFYWMAITSIKPNAELYNKNVMPLIVHAPTLKHYVDLLTKSSFLLWTWNTMLVAVVATAISLILGTMLAYPLARMRFAGSSLIAMTIAAIYLVPQPLLFIPLADVINHLHLGNTLTSVILTYPTMLVPFCAWLLLGYFKTVPKELEEAARIDGASRLRALRYVVAPNLRRVLEIVLVINTITAFAFMFTYIYTITNGGPGYDTYVSEYYIWNQAFTNQNMGYASAVGLTLVVLVLVVGFVQIRLLTKEER